ncbi:MAG: hypothetical protein IKP15_06640 [Bacteroidales bacterium]|nr:hypothetical protein [Bacteroidales bacterium]
MKKLLISIFALLLIGAAAGKAQDTVEASVSMDLVNDYVWRGQHLGDVSLQPSLGVSYKGLSLSAWGSLGLSNPADTKELDLTLGYTVGGFSISVTDYWFTDGPDPTCSYFRYGHGVTNHVFEATVGYDFGFLSLAWSTNFAGNDFTEAGKQAFSSYFELSVPFTLGGLDWTATAGAVPFATDFYGTGRFALTNLSLTASKDIRITDSFAIPVFAQLAANPYASKLYFVFGFTLGI